MSLRMARPGFFFLWAMCQRSLRRSQSLLPTEPCPLNWDLQAKNKSEANFAQSRSGKPCIESTWKSCSGRNRASRQFFPSSKTERREKNAREYRIQVHASERRTWAPDFLALEGTAVSGRSARWSYGLHNSQPLVKCAVSCVGIPGSNQSGADRCLRYDFLHYPVRRTRRNGGYPGHCASSCEGLEQRECQRLSA